MTMRQTDPPTGILASIDYLYTSLANGTSFAPADAMPLTSSMKSVCLASNR